MERAETELVIFISLVDTNHQNEDKSYTYYFLIYFFNLFLNYLKCAGYQGMPQREVDLAPDWGERIHLSRAYLAGGDWFMDTYGWFTLVTIGSKKETVTATFNICDIIFKQELWWLGQMVFIEIYTNFRSIISKKPTQICFLLYATK